MPTYMVFTRESRDSAELKTYSQKVGETLKGHPINVLAAYGRQEVVEGPEVEGVVICSSFRRSRRPRPGTIAPPIARFVNIDSEARLSGGHRRRGLNKDVSYRQWFDPARQGGGHHGLSPLVVVCSRPVGDQSPQGGIQFAGLERGRIHGPVRHRAACMRWAGWPAGKREERRTRSCSGLWAASPTSIRRRDPEQCCWSIAAGPLVNVVLLPITFGLCIFVSHGAGALRYLARRFLLAVTAINLVLLVFNVLPIYPLDGGQILYALLWFAWGEPVA